MVVSRPVRGAFARERRPRLTRVASSYSPRWALCLAIAAVAAGCGAGRLPLDPKEHVRGEHHRLIHEPVERLWPRVLQALDDDGIRVARMDRKLGAIETRPVRHEERDMVKRLREIADLSEARAAGMRGVSEYSVVYRLFLTPAGADTSVRITSAIDAIDRSDATFIGGVMQAIPHHVDVPSRGVLERQLLARLAASLFSAEEMLLVLGEPGLD